MGVVDFLRRYFGHAPSYSTALKLGYKARTYNGDFIFSRNYSACSVHVHQSIEPHNHLLAPWIDFEIEDACLIISCSSQQSLAPVTIDKIRELFDFVYARGPHLFCMDRKMDFNDPKLENKLIQLDTLLKS